MGIHNSIYSSITNVDVDIRNYMFTDIVLSGGSTLFPNIKERLTQEIAAEAPASVKVNVTAPPERKYLVWIGGSILASLSTFQNVWLTRAEYDEYGPEIVHRKFY